MEIILTAVCLAGLLIGSYTDLKTREVPDYVNYGLLFLAIGIRSIYSATAGSFSYIIDGAIGFLLGFAISSVLYYTGQWGGGDSKMLSALGALIGLKPIFSLNNIIGSFLIQFLILIALTGAAYGLIWSIIAAIKNRKSFSKSFKKESEKAKSLKLFSATTAFLFAIACFLPWISLKAKLLLSISIAGFILAIYLTIFIKSVEKSSMYLDVSPEKLTIGDWLAEDVVIKKGKKEIILLKKSKTGLEQQDIDKLIKLKNKGLISKVRLKTGIPFVPSFLAAFIITAIIQYLSLFSFS